MKTISLQQKRELVQTALSCGIMNGGIAGIQDEVNKADEIIGMYWTKYNENDGYWYARVPNGKQGGQKKLIKRRNKADMDEAILAAHEQLHGPMPSAGAVCFEKLYPEWRSYKLMVKEHMQSTAIRNDSCYKRYLEGAEWIRQDISRIRPIDIRKWLKITIAEREPTLHDYKNLHGIINGVFQYALDEGYVSQPIAPFIAGLGRNKKLFTPTRAQLPEYDSSQVYSQEEARKVMAQLQQDHINDLGLKLLFYTGLRIGELVALKWDDVAPDYSEILVRRRQTSQKEGNRFIHPVVNHTKGIGSYRRVLIPPELRRPLLEAVRKLNPEGEYIFSKNGAMLTPASFSSRLRRICRWAGVEFKSLHKIRKTVVTELMDHRLPMPLIQSQVGHASALTTETHYHFNNKTREENGRKIALALTDFLQPEGKAL